MQTYRFIIPGPLYGYRASLKRAHDPRYKAFKRDVRMIALSAGVPDNVDPKVQKVRLAVIPHWKRNPRIDWKNVYGAVEDAIFEQDRWVYPHPDNDFYPATGSEEAEVVVEIE